MGTPTEGQSPHGAALLPVPACPISPNAASEHSRCFVAAPRPAMAGSSRSRPGSAHRNGFLLRVLTQVGCKPAAIGVRHDSGSMV